ncbi:PTS beta-glucoside transporter subunit IIBCA [Lactiplantibacillus mudanjiangensis]|uniref:PTS system, beta-glucosides-specific EIIBCA component [Lactobacillus plantarum WCFS1] n=1 Tax=Lactiplantibacillus mudanjiangensis TaxID=1296538 RepID=A0A660E355_9LACO|nr:PTS beta-glucoside transporter subunit IIBCA [Lactiplantibacillus mudanjiangensis]VDG21037.1 PTS system, beta-glucosides-specific EIIBCA component [Lactobacillus plantarum WCFS1] [Lactiplantibacillus mudanjiangensis]VDG26050.1 PTS system, beta-glucosides-specific EIIBCA component [Lactobacillus plantarum WCFS1] [Lactiplantibacillus mudanjiangensis]VDG29112.1 PTS system, beta-glucosides-specific EIIBCA component [Lactobacillus plantarum WCFS1] [Lactiplantibacillus mudanjiangensis]VDG31632.1 P
MDFDASAKAIIAGVGGKQNIVSLIHCSTRLRFSLSDFDQADLDELKAIDGVLGAVIAGGQCQVIIGNDVVDMFDAVQNELGEVTGQATKGPKQSWGKVVLDFIISVFQPLVPAIAGGGILKALLMLLAMFGWISDSSQTYQILTLVGGAPLYFLPILVAITTAQKLKVNPLVAVSTVGVLILPDLVTMMTKGTQLFGMNVMNVTYSSQVFPAILSVLFYAVMERFFTKYSPKPIRIFFVPMMAMLITAPITLLFLGPLGYVVGEGFVSVILFLNTHLGWVATALLAGALPFMVATGMHKPMIPYVVSTFSTVGKETLYLPASLAHNISESGTCFAIAIRTKDTKMRGVALSAAISALFGITEPALYGVTLQHKRALTSVVIGSVIGGAYVGIVGLAGFTIVGPGLASLPMFVDKSNPANLIHALIGFGLSFVVSFVASLLLWKNETNNEAVKADATTTTSVAAEDLTAPIAGQVLPLSAVPDDVFSQGLIGQGIAVDPSEGRLVAPTDGTIEMVYETKHALGMKTDNGAEILFHIGLDTVQLNGQYFESDVQVGQHVTAGEVLETFDLDKIKAAGYNPITMMVVTNQDNYAVAVDEVTDDQETQSVMNIAKLGV